MSESNFTPQGQDADVLQNATRGTGVPAGKRVKAAAKQAMNDAARLWDSAFQAERGCLSGSTSPRHPAPPLQH